MDYRRWRLDLGVLCLAASLILICTLFRISSTTVDLDVRAIGVKVTVAGHVRNCSFLVNSERSSIKAGPHLRSGTSSASSRRAGGRVGTETTAFGNGEINTSGPSDLPSAASRGRDPSDIPFTLTLASRTHSTCAAQLLRPLVPSRSKHNSEKSIPIGSSPGNTPILPCDSSRDS